MFCLWPLFHIDVKRLFSFALSLYLLEERLALESNWEKTCERLTRISIEWFLCAMLETEMKLILSISFCGLLEWLNAWSFSFFRFLTYSNHKAVALWLLRSSPKRLVRVRALWDLFPEVPENFRPTKRFSINLYLETERCTHLKRLVWRGHLFILIC